MKKKVNLTTKKDNATFICSLKVLFLFSVIGVFFTIIPAFTFNPLGDTEIYKSFFIRDSIEFTLYYIAFSLILLRLFRKEQVIRNTSVPVLIFGYLYFLANAASYLNEDVSQIWINTSLFVFSFTLLYFAQQTHIKMKETILTIFSYIAAIVGIIIVIATRIYELFPHEFTSYLISTLEVVFLASLFGVVFSILLIIFRE